MRRLAAVLIVLLATRAEGQTPTRIDSHGAPVRFAIIGDYGIAGPNEEAVARLVNDRMKPDFVATVGDNNYPSGSARTIEPNIGRYYGKWIGSRRPALAAGPRSNRFFPALGNHDWGTPGAQPYLDYFDLPGNERYYDVRRGPVHLFIVDSDPHEPDGITADSVQACWLERALGDSTAPWKLVLFHHAAYSSAQHGSNVTMQWPFAEWGASAVIAGHDHTYERVEVEGFPYFVNGLGGHSRYSFGPPISGSRVRYNATHGAMLVEVDDDTCAFRFVTVDDVVVDTFVLARGAETPATQTLVRRGTHWRYKDDGVDPGPAWTEPVFDDGAWGVGFAEFGYGDGDERTTIGFGPDPNAKHVTSWFRREFWLSDPSAFSSLRLGVLRDDGAVAYLGGLEVFRTNMPDGPVASSTLASRSVAGSEESAIFDVVLPASLLVSGRNVVAVEVHQSAPSSSDLSFDAEIVAIAGTVLVPRGATWRFMDDGSVPPGWHEPAFDDSAWDEGPAQLGYGEGDEATTVGFGPDPDEKPLATLFRHAFFVPNGAALSGRGLAIRILRDDGAVVFLNGREAYRSNLPVGAPGPETRAGFTVAGADENVFIESRISPGPLRDGWNVLAVAVHQSDKSSSDLSFDLELVAE